MSMAEFQKQGNDPVEAERLALELVGSPETIAERASADLQGGWLMRCAWLLCGGGFFLGGLLSVFAIMLLGYYFSGGYAYYNGGGVVSLPLVQVEVVLLNWLPLLIGMAILQLLIRFSSVGWKSIFAAAIALGIAVSFEIHLAIAQVANSTDLCFLSAPDYNFIMQWLFKPLEGLTPGDATGILTFKLLTPLGMCLFARYVQPRLNEVRHPSTIPS